METAFLCLSKVICSIRRTTKRTSLAVQWLRLSTPMEEGMGLILGWGTKIIYATQCSQGKKKFQEENHKTFCHVHLKNIHDFAGVLAFLTGEQAHCSCCSVAQTSLFATPWTAALQASLSFIFFQSLLQLMSIESVMPSILSCSPLLLPSIFHSIWVFSNVSALCIRWPKSWSWSFSPSNEHSGLISFRMDWFDLLAVQGTLNSFFQHHSSKTSVLWCSAFFMVQLSHPYMTNGKPRALTRWACVGKVIISAF